MWYRYDRAMTKAVGISVRQEYEALNRTGWRPESKTTHSACFTPFNTAIRYVTTRRPRYTASAKNIVAVWPNCAGSAKSHRGMGLCHICDIVWYVCKANLENR